VTVITYPNNIANGDTPDWDLVQAYFDAIVTWGETTGLTNANINASAAISRSKLNLTGALLSADFADNVISLDKLLPPTLYDDEGVQATIAASTWTTTTATFTAADTGRYVVRGHANMHRSTVTGTLFFGARLTVNGVQTGNIVRDQRYSGSAGDLIAPMTVVDILDLTAADVVLLEVYTDGGSVTVPSGGCNITASRIQ